MLLRSGVFIRAGVPNGPATSATLRTCELVEQILLNLPTKDLVQAQRVCKDWKNLIGSSTKFHEQLFRANKPVKEVLEYNKPPQGSLGGHIPVVLPRPSGTQTARPIITLNPAFEILTTNWHDWKTLTRRVVKPVGILQLAGSPWRDTFISQPPVEQVRLIFHSGGRRHPQESWLYSGEPRAPTIVENRQGVKMSDIMAAISERIPGFIIGKHGSEIGIAGVSLIIENYLSEDSPYVKRARAAQGED